MKQQHKNEFLNQLSQITCIQAFRAGEAACETARIEYFLSPESGENPEDWKIAPVGMGFLRDKQSDLQK